MPGRHGRSSEALTLAARRASLCARGGVVPSSKGGQHRNEEAVADAHARHDLHFIVRRKAKAPVFDGPGYELTLPPISAAPIPLAESAPCALRIDGKHEAAPAAMPALERLRLEIIVVQFPF